MLYKSSSWIKQYRQLGCGTSSLCFGINSFNEGQLEVSAAKLYQIGIGYLFSIGIRSGAETLDLDKATYCIDNIDPGRRCSFQTQQFNYLWTLEKDTRINYWPNISRPSQSGCILFKPVKKVFPFKREGLQTQSQRLSLRIILNGIVNYCTKIWCFSKSSNAVFDGKLNPFLCCCFVLCAAPCVSPEAKVSPAETAGFVARHTADTLCCQQGCFSVRHLCSFLSSEVRLPDTKESRASEWLIPRQSRQHAGLQHRSAEPLPSLITTTVQCTAVVRMEAENAK